MIGSRLVQPGGLGLILVLGLSVPVRAAVQSRPDLDRELGLLRDATALETSGDLTGATRALVTVLESNPASLGALLALERVLAMTGRTAELLPHIDSLLALEPRSVIGHQMRVRAYATLGRVASLEGAVEAWIAAMPSIETPYREAARSWRRHGDYARAIQVLERGRKRIRRPDALALELGDAYADVGQFDRVAAEWARAVGPEGQAFLLVQRRVLALPDAGAAVIPGLVDRLARSPATTARLKAAVQLAIDAGLETRAARAATELASTLRGLERDVFLIELARRADGGGQQRLAYWAYGELVAAHPESGAWLPVRTRMAELALALGDTARAAAMLRALEGVLESGSPSRRQAIALRIEFLARDGDFDSARGELGRLREEFGDAPEIDPAAAHLANALVDDGRVGDAEIVLAGLTGPRASLARGRVRIHQREFDRARSELLSAAPLLHGAEATETIAFASLLGRVSVQGAELVSRAIVGGQPRAGLTSLLGGAQLLPVPERAAILEYAAELADAALLHGEAEEIRREIVEEFPRAPEAPPALLSLARSMIARNAPSQDVRLLLERMILEYPRSALLPQARRELDRLAEPRGRH